MSPLPRTFISASIAHNVKQDLDTEEAFLRSTSAAPAERLDDNRGVCLRALTEDEPLCNTKCMHIYHRECIDQLLVYVNNCPMCRAEWYSPESDIRIAESIRGMRDVLEATGRLELRVSLPRGVAWDFRKVLRHMVCRIAHCMQIQEIDWQPPQAFGVLSDPFRGPFMQEVSNSDDGYRAVQCLLRPIKRFHVLEIEQCVVTGQEFADVSHLVSRVVEDTVNLWKSCYPDHEMNALVKWCVRRLVQWTLVGVSEGLFLGQMGLEDFVEQEEPVEDSVAQEQPVDESAMEEGPVDFLIETEVDRQSLQLLNEWCPALC